MPTVIWRMETMQRRKKRELIRQLEARMRLLQEEVQELRHDLDGESSRLMFDTARPPGRLE